MGRLHGRKLMRTTTERRRPGRRRPERRRTILLGALLLALLATACTGGDGATAETPDGWTRHEQPSYAVSTPAAWTPSTQEADERLRVLGTEAVDESAVAVEGEVGTYGGQDLQLAATGALDVFRADPSRAYEAEDEREVDVAGADEAWLFAGSYQGESSERTRQWDVFASVDGDDELVYVSLKAPVSLFDADEMTRILGTLEIRR